MKVKTIIAVTLSVCLVCSGAGYGIYYYMQNNKKPVNVIPVSYLSTQYYGGSSSISGTTSSDVSQNVQFDGSNTIKEIYVKVGDQVKIGDKLMAYDTTLAELDLEMEKLNQATLGLKMEAAQKALDKLYNTTPVASSNSAAVISSSNTVSMAANENEQNPQNEEDPVVITLDPAKEGQVMEQTETPVTSQTDQPATEQTELQVIPPNPETQAPETQEIDTEGIPSDPQTENPIWGQTEPVTSAQTEPVTDTVETDPAEIDFVLPTEAQDDVVLVETLDYDSAADDGEGTKEKPFIFYCTENVIIKGSFLNLVRGWDEEGTVKIAGGAYVAVVVRAKDAQDGKQRVLYLDGISDKRDQGYRLDLEWKFTPEGLEVIVDQDGNRIPDDQEPELIKKKDFEREFAGKIDENETEIGFPIETEVQTQPQETIPETRFEIESEEETNIQTESEQDATESEPLQTEPTVQSSPTEEKLKSMIMAEVLETEKETEPESETQTETQPETESETEPESETESEIQTESETETETEPLATLPNATQRMAVKLSYESIDKKRYSSGSGTMEDPYVFVCVEDAQITGGFLNRVMGFDKDGNNRDPQKSCYVRLEIRENSEGISDYNGKAVIRVLLDGTAAADSGFVGTDIWIFGRLGLNKQVKPTTPTDPGETEEPEPGEEIEELYELNYLSLGDEDYQGGTYYKGTGTKEDPFTFRCMEGATVTSDFINRVLGYDEAGEERITDGCYVRLEIKDPDSEEGFIETITINGTEKHDPYPPTYSWTFTRDGLKLVEEPIDGEDPGISDFPIDDFPFDDGGITYTAEELEAAIREQQQLIKSLTLDEKEAELKIAQYEKKVKDGVILSSINGIVKTVGDAETGSSDGDAFIVVTSDSGMYIVGNVSELNLETLQIGDEVTAQSWETGMTYTAIITEISQYPTNSQNNYYGYGTENTNASYYPFKAYIEEADGLSDASSITISISAAGSNENTIYLQMAYIRSENGQSYVYKAADDGTLKKQYVKTGQIIYSSYMEIKEGLTMDDNIAFPYGSDVKDGAKTQVTDSSSYYY